MDESKTYLMRLQTNNRTAKLRYTIRGWINRCVMRTVVSFFHEISLRLFSKHKKMFHSRLRETAK